MNSVAISHYRFHVVLWIFIALFPILNLTDNDAQKLMHLILAFLVIAYLVIGPWNKVGMPRRVFGFVFIFSLTFIYYCAVTFSNLGRLDVAALPDLIRPLLYLFYLLIPILLPLRTSDDYKRIFVFLGVILIFQILFSLLVFIPELYALVDIYKGRKSSDSVVMHFYRASGTYIYPSDFAMFISFFIYYYFVLFYTNRRGLSVKQWGFVLLCLLGLGLTISRGGIAAIFFMIGVSYLCSRAKFNLRVNFFLLILGLCLLIFIGWILSGDVALNSEVMNFDYFLQAFGKDGEVDASTAHRFNEFDLGMRYLIEYFPFGPGPNREEFSLLLPVIESYYGHHMLKWGFLGLLLSLAFHVYFSVVVLTGVRHYPRGSFESVFIKASLIYVWSVPLIFGFSSAMSDRFKMLPTYYIISGMALALVYRATSRHKIGGLLVADMAEAGNNKL